MNIFDLDKALVDRYAAFARSFSTIKAADITEQVNAIYDLGKFWPDPLITNNPHFEQGSSMDQLADDGAVDPALRQIFAFGQKRAPLTLHRHQERAVAKVPTLRCSCAAERAERTVTRSRMAPAARWAR